MNLKEYFTNTKGTGILSTADNNGKVNSAIYTTPHLLDDGYVSFIMRNKLSLHNLQSNPYAHYLFMKKSNEYSGIRIYLEKVKEVQDKDLIAELSKRTMKSSPDEDKLSRSLVSFKITKIIELLGDKEITLE